MDLFCAVIDIPTGDRRTNTTTSEPKSFPRSAFVTSIGSFVRSFLLNKKNMFSLKVPKLSGALKLLLFIV